MGDKIASKKLAAKANVTTIPGYTDVIPDATAAVRIAQDVGYPVMIKASAGGGGKGLRVAHNDREAREGFVACQAEAKASFGDDRIFIEKFIEEPRHIEIQVLGDAHGNLVYLWERECSIQRRHQKVIEEAPSPFLDDATRRAMGEQAVALARAVDYQSAGTVEFVVGARQALLLPRDEHAAAGRASGDRDDHRTRSRRMDDPRRRGREAAPSRSATSSATAGRSSAGSTPRIRCAASCRRWAASSAIGRRRRSEGAVRVDTGVYEGGEISMYYDSMIAKLITHAPTRAEAIGRMTEALNAFVIRGIASNIVFQSALLRHPRFAEGRLSTAFIAEEFPDGLHARRTSQRTIPPSWRRWRRPCIAPIAIAPPASRARCRDTRSTWARITSCSPPARSMSCTRARCRAAATCAIGGQAYAIRHAWRFGEILMRGTCNGMPFAVQVERPQLSID